MRLASPRCHRARPQWPGVIPGAWCLAPGGKQGFLSVPGTDADAQCRALASHPLRASSGCERCRVVLRGWVCAQPTLSLSCCSWPGFPGNLGCVVQGRGCASCRDRQPSLPTSSTSGGGERSSPAGLGAPLVLLQDRGTARPLLGPTACKARTLHPGQPQSHFVVPPAWAEPTSGAVRMPGEFPWAQGSLRAALGGLVVA